MIHLKYWRKKTANQEYGTQQSGPSEWREDKDFPTHRKAEGLHHHQAGAKEVLKGAHQAERKEC